MEILVGLFAAAFLGGKVVKVADKHTKVFSGPFTLLFGKRASGGILPPLVPWLWNMMKDKPAGAEFQSKYDMDKNYSPHHTGLLVDGNRYRLSAQESFTHLALIAPTGAGKTTRYIIPNVYSLASSKDAPSLVITDPKGEIHTATSASLKAQGYQLQVLNLRHWSRGHQYNPLAHITSYDDVADVAHILVKSAYAKEYEAKKYWYQGAESLLVVIISALRGMNNPAYLNLPNALRLLQQMVHKKAFEAFLDRYADEDAWNDYEQLALGPQKAMDYFYSIATGSLRLFNNPELRPTFSGNMINFRQLRQEKTALFIILPPNRADRLSVVMSLVYTQLFSTLMEEMPSDREKSVFVLGDEWGHTAVPDFPTITTTIRAYRVSLSIILQNLGQLEEKYGKSGANTIVGGGMGNKMFFGGADFDTTNHVSRLLGKKRVKNSNGNGYWEENLLNPDRVRTLKKEEAILVSSNKEPAFLEKTAFSYLHPEYKQYMRQKPVPLPRIPNTPLSYVKV